jgi:hypothetical protein
VQDFLQNRPQVSSPSGSHSKPHGHSGNGGSASFDTALLGAAHSPQPGGHGDVSIEALKEGERVTKLIVTCRCGERIEILCAYGHR